MRVICMNLHQAASITGGTLIGKPIQFRGISTDSRSDCSGKLFIALKGENFNGENYCQQAIDNGAIAALVSCSQDISIPQIIVEESLKALSILAKIWAKQCDSKIIAITGSNGKTTVKNMIYSILSQSNKCSATQENQNNEIGVPLTLCAINADDKYTVVEMGAAKLGDISWLVSLVDIHTAAITNVSAAHIGRFESFENIVHEKGQIISTLGKDDYAVLPIDDEHFAIWNNNTISNVISFGESSDAGVSLDSIEHINLPLAGKHNQINAACASAIAKSCGINADDIQKGLENFNPASGRLENLGLHNGNIVINDSYNANPQSVRAAIDVLSNFQSPTTLVLGDMAELGCESEGLHSQIGSYAKQKHISHLLTIGKDSKHANLAFSDDCKHFNSIKLLKNHMVENWTSLGTILVKGSRGMKLENLIDGLINQGKVA